ETVLQHELFIPETTPFQQEPFRATRCVESDWHHRFASVRFVLPKQSGEKSPTTTPTASLLCAL
ncbi:hypothetical protein NL533_33795, partial [Klebsiella pneumoniae]|nr:hypothetical protein [Klebsiella pneumoniae]